MEYRIVNLEEKKLIGHSIEMSLADNKTFELWSGFMPQRKSISNAKDSLLFSLQVYQPALDLSTFCPQTVFTKWALVEVEDFNDIPEGMKFFTLEKGQYVVFNYKGTVEEFGPFMGKVFMEWLPANGYKLDHRPHFELLGEKYKHNDPNSEEEIWVPILPKQ